MYVSQVGTHPRRAPGVNGPSAEPLITSNVSESIGVVHLEIPAGFSMPEHDHGTSQIVLVPLSGSLELRQGEYRRQLTFGTAAHIGVGERVGLANLEDGPATVMALPRHRSSSTASPHGGS
jgi:quercetin dioxygenase-like cupin family protein